MQMISPVGISDAMLISSSLPETDYAAWNGATAYSVGDRVVRASVHAVYQRLVAGTTPTAPESDTANWDRVGPTNRWAMFDKATGSASSAASSVSVTIAPGLVRALALLDVDASSVTVTMVNGADTVYERTVSLNTGYGVRDWYSYFFAPIVNKRTLVLTDLPPYKNGHITITVTGGGTVRIGTVAVGSLIYLGETRYGVGFSMIDYSVKSTDAFGVTTITERAYAKRMTVPVVIRNNDLDEIVRQLQFHRAKAVVFIGARRYDQAVIYGFAKDWAVTIPYAQVSEANYTIEGLS